MNATAEARTGVSVDVYVAGCLAGLPWSSKRLDGISTVTMSFARALVESTDPHTKEQIIDMAPVIAAARADAESDRAWMIVDWMQRDALPRLLDLAGLAIHAAQARSLPEFRADTADAMVPELRRIQRYATASGEHSLRIRPEMAWEVGVKAGRIHRSAGLWAAQEASERMTINRAWLHDDQGRYVWWRMWDPARAAIWAALWSCDKGQIAQAVHDCKTSALALLGRLCDEGTR